MCAHRAHMSENRAPGRGNVRAGCSVQHCADMKNKNSQECLLLVLNKTLGYLLVHRGQKSSP